MPRFFTVGTNAAKGIILITGSDAEHIRVLRMKLGERLVICDGKGTDHRCHISHLGDNFAEATVDESVRSPAEPSVRFTMLIGMPKGDKPEMIVQKCTELGAGKIVFFQCERCVSKPEGKALERKIDRWQKIAEEAAKQSGRGIIPEISSVGSFAEALDIAIKTDLSLFMYETGDRMSLKETLQNIGKYESCAIITGPEGGFEKFEADLANAAGMKICSMGPRILRCETAPLCALTAVLYSLGDL